MRSSLTFRAILLGTLLIPLNCVFILKTEVVWASMQATPLSLFFNVICTLFVLIALNGLAHRLAPRHALRPGELLTVYVMCSVGTALFGVDMLQIFIGLLPHPYQFADDSNHWKALFFRDLPKGLVVTDLAALKPLYEGHSTLFHLNHLRAWLQPVLAWGVFLAALLTSYLCLAALVRRPWSEQERLTFPIIQLPLAMAESRGFWQSRLLWGGFTVGAGLNLLRALHTLHPAVPMITQQIDLGPFLVTSPWNAIGWTPLGVYPFAVGLGYLIPLDLAFSSWFFYLFWKAQVVFRAAVGWEPLAGAYLGRQSSGAWLGIGLTALWGTRKHFGTALRAAFLPPTADSRQRHRGPEARRKRLKISVSPCLGGRNPRSAIRNPQSAIDALEPLAYRSAFLGLFGAAVVLAVFCRLVGMAWWVIGLFFALYALIVVCVARMRAELGPPTHDLARGGPDHLLPMFFGTDLLGPRHLTMLTLFDWFNYSYRQHPVAHQLEGFKIAERVSLPMRKMTAVMAWAMAVSYVAWLTLSLDTIYHEGFKAKILSYLDDAAQQAWDNLGMWLSTPVDPDWAGQRQLAFGLALTVGLMGLRKVWLFFPLHPVGYAVCGCWTMSWMWFSLFLSWLVKLLIIRYGGLQLYRQALPLFLGLILGDYVVGGGQCLISALLDHPVRGFFP